MVLLCYLRNDLVAIELITSQMYTLYGKCLILCSINGDDFILKFEISIRLRIGFQKELENICRRRNRNGGTYKSSHSLINSSS